MRADRAVAAVAVGLTVAAVLAGCSAPPPPVPTPSGLDLSAVDLDDPDRNGIEYLDGERALEAVLRAVRSSSGATVDGTIVEAAEPSTPGGDTTIVDGRSLRLSFEGTARTYRAEITVDGARASVVTADGRSSLSGDGSLTGLSADGAATGAEGAGGADPGGAVCVTPTDPAVTRFSPLLSPALLIATLTGADDDALGVSTGAVTTDPAAPDSPTVELVVGDESSTVGTLVVSAVGEPWPLSFTAADGSGRGDFTFTGWDDPAEVTPPDCD